MNIKDPKVYRLARELAQQRGTSMTGAVRSALEEALDRTRQDQKERLEKLRAIANAAKSIEAPVLRDEDIYDESGAPR